MATTINTSLQNRQADSWASDLNSGALEIYTGGQPAANAAPTGTLLALLVLANPAFAASVAGVAAALGLPISSLAISSGTAGYCRLRNNAASRWMYGSVTVTGGGGALQLDSLVINISDLITLTSLTITQPAS